MRTAGVDHPERAARLLIAHLDGLLYDAPARPCLGENDGEDPHYAIDAIVSGITSRG